MSGAALVDEARAEGTVTWYTALPAGREQIAAAFTREHGVDVAVVNAAGGTVIERFLGEARTGSTIADVLTTGPEPEILAKAAASRWIEPIEDAQLPTITTGSYPADRFPVGLMATVQVSSMAVGFDTTIVDESARPTTWLDLADDRYAGMIACPSPRSSDAFVQFWSLLRSMHGDDFVAAFAANKPTYYLGAGPPVAAMVAGRHPIVAAVGLARFEELERSGAPVGHVIPEPSTGCELGVALVAAELAPHPNAARLFADFLVSPRAAAAVRRSGMSVHDGDVPDGYVRPPLDTSSAEREELFALMKA